MPGYDQSDSGVVKILYGSHSTLDAVALQLWLQTGHDPDYDVLAESVRTPEGRAIYDRGVIGGCVYWRFDDRQRLFAKARRSLRKLARTHDKR